MGLAESRFLEAPEILESSLTQRIAADLAGELEKFVGPDPRSVIEFRRFLAVKGYRDLRMRAEEASCGKTGADALRHIARALRSFALERPGLSAATWRSPVTDCPEWREAVEELGAVLARPFAEMGIAPEAALQAQKMLRSLIRGFVLHEVTGSFIASAEHDASFGWAIETFIKGLA